MSKYFSDNDYASWVQGHFTTANTTNSTKTPLVPTKMITRRELKIFCNRNGLIITKEIFEEMEDSIPLGVDLLTELVKIGATEHEYVKTLLRERKLKRITNE